MVIYIDGPINAGKTTVSRLLAQRLADTVHIEVDDLRHFAECLTLDEAIPFALEDAIMLTQNWVRRGFSVVVSWPIGAQDHRQFAQAVTTLDAELHTFTLLPRQEICLSNRGARPLTIKEIDRIHQMYAWRREQGSVGTLIDNSEQTPDQTVDTIIQHGEMGRLLASEAQK